MVHPDPLDAHRAIIREHYLADEAALTAQLSAVVALSDDARRRAQAEAGQFVERARGNAVRSSLIDKFLQEYGLSTAEGVTLMRLAEALLRTPDAATANSLIEDKIEAGDWAAHKGKSPFPLVNFSTRALMLTANWLDEIEAEDPLGRMAASTKAALDRLGEPVIRASVAQAMRVMGEHFVLGQTIGEAMRCGRKYESEGYRFSFDMLGEAAHTAADAEKYFADYKDAIAAIAEHAAHDDVADNPGISVKLSALHPRYEYAKKDRVLKELGERTATLARQAKEAGIGFNIDAEEADRLDLSLDIIERLARDPALKDWAGFGVVVQAYQRRAMFVLDWLAALARDTKRRIMVRLVKGAYWDAEIKRAQVMGLESYPVFTRKVLTDFSFLACARKILSSTDAFFPQFATHNALTATTVMEMAGDYADYEFQRLHGMGEALHDSLIAHGARSRIYAPVGGHKELLPYLVRRLLENGANSSFVNQLIDPDLSVDDIVADPIDEIAELDAISNPHIPSPRNHLNGHRLSAKGWDETHPPTASDFENLAETAVEKIDAAPIVNGVVLTRQQKAIRSPTNRKLIVGTVADATAEDVANACSVAAEAARDWLATPTNKRADALRRAADMLEDEGERFMILAVREAGKNWPDAIAEIREAVDFLRYYADECETLERSPLGVVACISPWNFPLAIFLGQVSGALAAGNAVIAKPAEQTPLIAFEAVKLLHAAGVPANALHFLPGDGAGVGAPLTKNAAVNGVVFTGSTETAQAINRALIDTERDEAALIAETGGINAMIIDSTALLEQAVTDVVASAFQSAGQRCSACRVVCVQDDVFDRFKAMLAGAMAELRVGDPSDLRTDVGPVIDEAAHRNIESHIDRLNTEGRLIARAPDIDGHDQGCFIRPAAFEIADISELEQEIFGPVLHVVRFQSGDLLHTVDQINALGFGLTLGVHSRIDETMETISRRARVGNVYVNRNQIGAVVGVQPFGGEGLSGTGPKAGGPHYLKALTRRTPYEDKMAAPLMSEITGPDESLIDKANAAYLAWNRFDRGDVLSTAIKELEIGEAERTRILNAFQQTQHNAELPGPTGEANTLKLRGRGVAFCLGASEKLPIQALLALAAGNTVIAPAAGPLNKIAAILEEKKAPDHALTLIDGAVPTSWLLHDALRSVLYDGDAGGRMLIERVLARRKGAIAQLLSSADEPWRFCVERTLTINTTAAGGDVRLLSLGE
ncbi:MAG: bifunctional proline dehydrogenase/L-glutamate gamma-semialdehyde dehydrogenase PutA [Pseudomonadota bacterium]